MKPCRLYCATHPTTPPTDRVVVNDPANLLLRQFYFPKQVATSLPHAPSSALHVELSWRDTNSLLSASCGRIVHPAVIVPYPVICLGCALVAGGAIEGGGKGDPGLWTHPSRTSHCCSGTGGCRRHGQCRWVGPHSQCGVPGCHAEGVRRAVFPSAPVTSLGPLPFARQVTGCVLQSMLCTLGGLGVVVLS